MSHYVRTDQPDAQPNETELRLAGDIRYRLVHDIARQLAAVREGSTLEGPRSTVETHTTIDRHVLESDPSTLEHVTRGLWRRWVDELAGHGLRPVGWPAVTRRQLAWTPTDPGPVEVPADDDSWALVELSIECEGVPAVP